MAFIDRVKYDAVTDDELVLGFVKNCEALNWSLMNLKKHSLSRTEKCLTPLGKKV